MRKIQENEVEFAVIVFPEEDDDPADHFTDPETVAWVKKQITDGSEWAWCSVTVTATLTLPDGSKAIGEDHLGACSYESEAAFKQPGDYYDDMKANALDDLQRGIEAQITRGAQLAEWFKQCEWTTVKPGGHRCSLAPGHAEPHDYTDPT